MNQGHIEMPEQKRAEILELAAMVCNDELSDVDAQRLDDLLLDDVAVQQAYTQYMMMHAELYWLDDSIVRTTGPQLHCDTRSKDSLNGETETSRRMPLGWLASLAAVLLIGLGLGITGNRWLNSTGPNSQRSSVVPAKVLQFEQVAEVTGSLNCRWKTDDNGNLGFGSEIFAGQKLRLVEGVAEITFETGARMILQAPAELDISAFDETVLHSGRLTTTCPPGAEGFRVNTDGLLLVDLGTEFGVLTDELGNTEVHVFEGLVEGHYRESVDGPIRKVQWRQDETVHFNRIENKISALDKPGTSFVRTLSPNLGPISGLLAAEDFNYPVGRLGGQNGGFGWAGPWNDISLQGNLPEKNAVSAGNLRYGILTSSGNHAALKGQFNRIRRVLSTSFSGVFDSAGYVEEQDGARIIGRDGTTLYIGFAQKIDKLNQVFYGVELHRGDGNRNRVLCVGHGAARGWKEGSIRAPDKSVGVTGWAVTSESNGVENALLELGSLGEETTDVTLFVLKINFGKSNEDTIEVFMNPESLWDEARCTPQVIGKGNFAFDRISLANFEGKKTFEVDHIRIGNSFSAVTRPSWRNDSTSSKPGSASQ